MTNIASKFSLGLGIALFAGTALLAGCADPAPVTRTTTTEQTTTTPAPVVSTTTTTTRQQVQHP